METQRYKIKSALRQLWLRSVERSAALKRDNYSCVKCGVKKSQAKGKEQKVEVHHKEGVLNWDILIDEVYKHLLCDSEGLETLCPSCHESV